MQITALYVYPIKALRGIPLQQAELGPQGIKYDRRFMLFRVIESGGLKKLQLSSFPQCALFEQAIVGADIVVRYHTPAEPIAPEHPLQNKTLTVPLEPNISELDKIDINLHSSPASCYRMGTSHDAWFSACFGFEVILVYIGDGRRKVLGSLAPQLKQKQQRWLSTLSSYVVASPQEKESWLTFTDVSPFLITAEASLPNVSARLADGNEMPMYKFRPNIVVDGEEEWAEDFWAELELDGGGKLLLTGNCARCSSLNVDYSTGQTAIGEMGTVLKKLMKDRRVDTGNKWSPIFGRYGFLEDGEAVQVAVGDRIDVTKRLTERCVWDWPNLA